jgi:cell division protein FtsQ
MPTVMPLDVKLMNTFSVVLGLAFAAMVVALGVAWVLRQSCSA